MRVGWSMSSILAMVQAMPANPADQAAILQSLKGGGYSDDSAVDSSFLGLDCDALMGLNPVQRGYLQRHQDLRRQAADEQGEFRNVVLSMLV